MQFNFLPPAPSMASRVMLREAGAPGQPVEVDPNTAKRAPVAPRKTLRERLRRPILIALLAALSTIGASYYLAEEPYVSTNDAFVRAAKESVNARVSGQVVEIAVGDNQHVQKGQLLFRIDPEPYQIAVDQAEARLGSARLQVGALKATYRQQLTELQSAKEVLTSTSVSMDARSRSPPPTIPRRRRSTGPGRISRSPVSASRRSNSRSPTPWSR